MVYRHLLFTGYDLIFWFIIVFYYLHKCFTSKDFFQDI